MYSDVVMEVGKKYFEQLIDEMKEKKGVTQDVDLTAEDLKELAMQFKAEYKSKIGQEFPSDPKEQLMGAIKAVFRSWDNPRANVYRRDERYPLLLGHRRQRAVHGLRQHGRRLRHRRCLHPQPRHRREEALRRVPDQRPGRGRGRRRPHPHAHRRAGREVCPRPTSSSQSVCKTLEDHYRDMQDMEFTVEHGKLYMLQTRNGKRTAAAALKIACDLVDEGMIDEKEAVLP